MFVREIVAEKGVIASVVNSTAVTKDIVKNVIL